MINKKLQLIQEIIQRNFSDLHRSFTKTFVIVLEISE